MKNQQDFLLNILDDVKTYIPDTKHHRLFEQSILQDVLGDRPYVRALALCLFNGRIPATFDRLKLAQSCLTHLVPQDMLYWSFFLPD